MLYSSSCVSVHGKQSSRQHCKLQTFTWISASVTSMPLLLKCHGVLKTNYAKVDTLPYWHIHPKPPSCPGKVPRRRGESLTGHLCTKAATVLGHQLQPQHVVQLAFTTAYARKAQRIWSAMLGFGPQSDVHAAWRTPNPNHFTSQRKGVTSPTSTKKKNKNKNLRLG